MARLHVSWPQTPLRPQRGVQEDPPPIVLRMPRSTSYPDHGLIDMTADQLKTPQLSISPAERSVGLPNRSARRHCRQLRHYCGVGGGIISDWRSPVLRRGGFKGRAPTARAKAPDVLRLAAEGMKREAIARQLGIGVSSVYRALKVHRMDGR